MPGERGKGNSVACFHRRKLLYFPLSPYETEAACKPSLAMHLLALLLRLSVILLLSSFFLTGDWSCSSAQPGATWPGALSGQHSPNLWSGYPCLGSYTHIPLEKPRTHLLLALQPGDGHASPGDTSNEPAGGSPSAKQCAVLGSP